MSDFRCLVLQPDGGEKIVEIGAGSKKQAAEILKREGLFILDIDSVGPNDCARRSVSSSSVFFVWVGKNDLILVIRQLAVLLESGISIVRSLDCLERQSGSRGMRIFLSRVREDVESGCSFSDALAVHGRGFKQYIVSMVRAAESSGELDVVMNRVADKLEEEAAFKRQIVTAMIYPTMVLAMAVVVVMLLGLFIIPKFAPMLGNAGKSIPWSTQFVLDASSWIQVNWQRMISCVAVVTVCMLFLRRSEQGGYLVDSIMLRVPVIGRIIKSGTVISFSTNLATLYASGIPISDALQTVRGTLSNCAASRVVDRMVDSILNGESLVDPLRRNTHIFPPMVAEMIATGEETGEMEKSLLLLARIFRAMLENFVKRMTAMIEPLMIVILGGIVGFVFYALISGVLSVYGL